MFAIFKGRKYLQKADEESSMNFLRAEASRSQPDGILPDTVLECLRMKECLGKDEEGGGMRSFPKAGSLMFNSHGTGLSHFPENTVLFLRGGRILSFTPMKSYLVERILKKEGIRRRKTLRKMIVRVLRLRF